MIVRAELVRSHDNSKKNREENRCRSNDRTAPVPPEIPPCYFEVFFHACIFPISAHSFHILLRKITILNRDIEFNFADFKKGFIFRFIFRDKFDF